MYDTQGESADYGAPGARAGAGETGAAAEESGRKLVRTASLTIRSTAFESDVEKVTALLKELGGYVENLYQFGDTQSGSTRTVSLSMRVDVYKRQPIRPPSNSTPSATAESVS